MAMRIKKELKLIAAEEVILKDGQRICWKSSESMDYIEVESQLVPYTDPREFQRQSKFFGGNKVKKFLRTDSTERLSFSGHYGR